MRMKAVRATAVALSLLFVVGAAQVPVAVSPGSPSKMALSEDRCPTFSWGQVVGARTYDLVVYRLAQDDGSERPVLRRTFPGSVHGWTPTADQCLERGARYAWSVRAVGRSEAGEWSPPSLFQVVPGLSETEFQEALTWVQRYISERRLAAAPDRRTPLPGADTVPDPISETSADLPAAAASGSQAFVAYGDSCCDGNDPSSYATELGNSEDTGDPDVLSLVLEKVNQPAANVNYIGFFHRQELGSAPELVGEIEGNASGGLHFTGSASISGWERVVEAVVSCSPGNFACPGTVSCPAGKRVLGGGFAVDPAGTSYSLMHVWANYPSSETSWYIGISNDDVAQTLTYRPYAICAEVGT